MTVFDAVDLSTWETIGRLAAAVGLGAAIGLQREVDGHDAGIRTHALLALGAATFGAISVGAFAAFVAPRADSNVQVDVTRVASYVVAGVGFLAGGTIIKSSNRVRGLTTATSLFTAAGVGLACGLGFFAGALAATVATLFVLWLEHPIARVVRKGQLTTLRAVMSSRMSTSEFVELLEHSGGHPHRVHRIRRGDGNTEFEAVGVARASTQRLIGELEARDDVLEVSYSHE